MKLKGYYGGDASYEVGDIVLHSNGIVYILQHPCATGTPPTETLYWGQLDQELADSVHLILDAMEMLLDKMSSDIPTNITDSVLTLKSSTASSDKVFNITVDDDGDLTATEVVEEAEEET